MLSSRMQMYIKRKVHKRTETNYIWQEMTSATSTPPSSAAPPKSRSRRRASSCSMGAAAAAAIAAQLQECEGGAARRAMTPTTNHTIDENKEGAKCFFAI